MGVDVRPGRGTELPDVLNILDGAALETEHDRIREQLASENVLVAVPTGGSEPIVGACVLDGEEIVSIAVRLRRRDRGIGRALVGRAAADRDRLVAEFDRDVLPFYEALGFDVRPTEGDRYEGVLATERVR